MKQRGTENEIARFRGGGPADGERRPIEHGADLVTITEPRPADDDGRPAREIVHLYERQPDGTFAWEGMQECEIQTPAVVPDDPHAHALAALGHEKGPGFGVTVLAVVGIAVVMIVFLTQT